MPCHTIADTTYLDKINVFGLSFCLPSYLKTGVAAIIVVADWDEQAPSVTFNLAYDWHTLGLQPTTATLTAPSLPPFQVASGVVGTFATNHTFTVDVQQGGIILLLR